ncbi:hypothetical protein RQP46_005929 [Phenoliferia psychrophenolica]
MPSHAKMDATSHPSFLPNLNPPTPGPLEPSRSTPPSPTKAAASRALLPPAPQRTQSHSNPPTFASEDPDELSPLLRTSPSYSRLTGGDATASEQWTAVLKRRSAALSDMISRHNHSGWAVPQSPLDETESVAGEDGPFEGMYGVMSDAGSVRTTQWRPTRPKGYDGEFRNELQAAGGVRMWYASFESIDWLHDWVKNAMRMKKIRRRRREEGVRGWLVNMWDGAQGWVLCTIVGFVTACIAFCIVRSEMLFFDLKDGYCSRNVFHPKRFCCTPIIPTRPLLGELGIAAMSKELEKCEYWMTWSQVWNGSAATGPGGPGDDWRVDYAAFIAVALVLATTASYLTIKLTASTSVFSSKDDSPSVPYPGFSPSFPKPSQKRPASIYGGTDVSDTTPAAATPEDLSALPKPRKVMYFAAGSGIPEIKTILSGTVIRGYLGSWTLVTKSVGLALSVGSGLSLGKEGPFVHIASCVGNITSRFFPKYDLNEAKRREVISAACAAGVAVSFGAPVGGTLFSLEEVSYFFPPKVMWRSFWCAMIAAMTLKVLDPFGSGKIVLFEVTYDRDWHSFELVGFVLLGIFGGAYGALFCRANIWWTRNVRNATFFKSHPIAEVACVTLVTVAISFLNPFTKMGGTELVYELFSECHKADSFDGLCVATPSLAWELVGSLVFVLVTKALLTTVTFGIKLPAGIFIPTLAVGACVGRIAGLIVEVLHARYPLSPVFEACRAMSEDGPLPFGQACVMPGIWAMIGAAAALAGVTRTTVSLAVIMFELTGTLNYTVPVMLAVLVAKTDDLVIELSDLPFLDIKTEYVHESNPADILDDEAPTISLDEENTVESLTAKLAHVYQHGTGGGFPLIARDGGGDRVFGYLACKELEHGLSTASLSTAGIPCTFKSAASVRMGLGLWVPSSQAGTPAGCDLSYLVDLAPVTVSIHSPMVLVHEMFSKLGVRYLIIVDERGLYRGVIEKNRYLKYLHYVERSHTSRQASPSAGPA